MSKDTKPKKKSRQQVFTLLVQVGRKHGDGLPDKATGAALMCFASGVDEAEAVRETVAILKQAENGVPVSDLCREHGMSSASFYKWRSKYGGMDASLMARMKELDEENKRLKKMYAEKSLQNDLLKEALGKKW